MQARRGMEKMACVPEWSAWILLQRGLLAKRSVTITALDLPAGIDHLPNRPQVVARIKIIARPRGKSLIKVPLHNGVGGIALFAQPRPAPDIALFGQRDPVGLLNDPTAASTAVV